MVNVIRVFAVRVEEAGDTDMNIAVIEGLTLFSEFRMTKSIYIRL